MDQDQTAQEQSDLGPHCMTKQTTIVVIGSLRVNRSKTRR